jgi:hypothetical protein
LPRDAGSALHIFDWNGLRSNTAIRHKICLHNIEETRIEQNTEIPVPGAAVHFIFLADNGTGLFD